MANFFDKIDMIVYINIDNRTDRNKSMIEQLNRLNAPSNKITRFSAIPHSNKSIGCYLSQIAVIQMAKENKWSNVLILEDDFIFIDNIYYINTIFNDFFNSFQNDWDVVNMSRGYYNTLVYIGLKNFLKVNDNSTTSCYMVNSNFYNTLLEKYISGYDLLCRYPIKQELYCISRWWKTLQEQSRWYIVSPSIGYMKSIDISKSYDKSLILSDEPVLETISTPVLEIIKPKAEIKYFHDLIDKIVYINLDKRTDRKQEILAEFTRMQIPEEKIIRFSAIENKEGAIGCTLSHIDVIRMAKENNWSNILVLEDDFNFINDTKFIDYIFKLFFNLYKDDWDVLCLSRGFYQNFSETNNKFFSKVNDVSTTSGYMVNNHFYDKLLANFIEGCNKLKEQPKNHPLYCIDRYWTNLLKDSRWYIFTPSIGYQRTGYSSIGNIVVNYIEYDKTLRFDTISIDTNPVTIVTCFYDLKSKSKNSSSKYYDWMKNFLNKPMNIIIYIDRDDIKAYNFIIEHRKDFMDKTHIIRERIDEWETYKYLDYWKHCYTIDSEKSYHSLELYMLWNEKTYFIERSMRINPFNSEWFFWTDIGCCRNDSDINKFMSYPNYDKIQKYDMNKIIISSIDPIKCNDTNEYIPQMFSSNNLISGIQGGFFGGHINSIKKWIDTYNMTLKIFINNNIFGGKDQNIMTYIAIKNTEFVHIINASDKYGDKWFDFLYTFS